jgi:hypothetical protein
MEEIKLYKLPRRVGYFPQYMLSLRLLVFDQHPDTASLNVIGKAGGWPVLALLCIPCLGSCAPDGMPERFAILQDNPALQA